MRSLFVALSVGIMLLSACSGSKNKILTQKKMAQLMTEVHLLDGYLSLLSIDSSRKVIDTLYKQLFASYGLDSASFSENLTYYYSDPEKTEKIYDKIQEDLNARDKEIMRLDSIQTARQQDSTNRANRYHRLLGMQQNLLRMYHQPDAVLNLAEYNMQLYRGSGMEYMWQVGTQRIPSRASTARPPDPHAHIPESLRPQDEALLDSVAAFEVYKENLYQSIGLSRFWPGRSSLKEVSAESPSSDEMSESPEQDQEVEVEAESDENETAS